MQEVVFQYRGKEYRLENVRTYADIAQGLTNGHHNFLVCKVQEKMVDLNAPITENSFQIDFFNFETPEGKDVYWHTAAHILAQAVKKLYPGAKYTIGPSIENGFYYDFDLGDKNLTPEDMEAIEKEARKITEANYPVVRKELSKDEALVLFQSNPYKIEIIKELPDEAIISIYEQGDFVDLCRGPHLSSTGVVKELKVMSIAGAYWRGDSTKKMLQRVYAIAFDSSKALKKYLNFLEEAKKRDHRKLGKELDLFSFHEEGPGFPFWHAKGTVIFNSLVDYMREENDKRGYVEIKTPPILNDILWKKSGHWDNFKDNMYFTEIDERGYAVKPMNCPGGLLVYNTRLHSYRELPLKQAEFGLVHRHELSGVLHGLFRVRSFTQDDAHIFCTIEQLKAQIEETIAYVLDVYRTLGFENFKIFIATRPVNSIGTEENWSEATRALEEALEALGLSFGIKAGEGAFYGPKIEFNILDSLERNWQCGTIQVDFSMPERLDVSYEGSDGNRHRPIMVHRAILGSFERFIGILLEHFAGKLPTWLSPVQVKVINVAAPHLEYANQVLEALRQARIRVEPDFRDESLGYRIRDARNMRIPFIVVIGDKEVAEKNLSVRDRSNESVSIGLDELKALIKDKVQTRVLE